VLPQVQSIICALRDQGRTPVNVYNTNGYDRVQSLAALEPLIDAYLPDLKYMDGTLAGQLSGAPDYPGVAMRSIREMVRQKGVDLILNDEGEIQSGVIVRHLVLPGHIENSRRVLRFLAEEISPRITISLMSQYSPQMGKCPLPELDRAVTAEEYAAVLDEMDFLGLENGWVQELDSRDCYQPDFVKSHPFET
jgi:putative pyruvate formate lyase activating enzyme